MKICDFTGNPNLGCASTTWSAVTTELAGTELPALGISTPIVAVL